MHFRKHDRKIFFKKYEDDNVVHRDNFIFSLMKFWSALNKNQMFK